MASGARRWRRSASNSRIPTSPPSSPTSETRGATGPAKSFNRARSGRRGSDLARSEHQEQPMSAVIDSGHAHDEDAQGPYTGIMRWITTTNHKDIGTLYLWFSFIMFMTGGAMATVIRAELFTPGLQIVDPDFFNQMT